MTGLYRRFVFAPDLIKLPQVKGMGVVPDGATNRFICIQSAKGKDWEALSVDIQIRSDN